MNIGFAERRAHRLRPYEPAINPDCRNIRPHIVGCKPDSDRRKTVDKKFRKSDNFRGFDKIASLRSDFRHLLQSIEKVGGIWVKDKLTRNLSHGRKKLAEFEFENKTELQIR